LHYDANNFKEFLMNTAALWNPSHRLERALTYAVPLVSFGGILLGVVLQHYLVITDAGTFVWGCVAGAFFLGYLAYTRPRKDIVALCAPLYAILLFLVPLEIPPTIPLQLLFAASITYLLVRLNRKFGSSGDARGGSDPMERFLRDYINRIKPEFGNIQKKTAHEIASAFFSFKFGLYQNTVEESRRALALLPDGGSNDTLKKALRIVQANAESLENAQVTAVTSVSFTEDERALLAIKLPQDKIEDPGSLDLENALILLFAVAKNTSMDDEQALEEHQKFVIKILTSYKSALGIV
jgi:hypothetical protein